MRKINKGPEPSSFTNWKRQNSQKNYDDLPSEVRQDIRITCTQEQYYLCAYCCKEISGTNTDTMNEHVQARHHFPQFSLDFNNIVASCTTKGQCDDKHGSQILPLTPLIEECECELEFRLNGQVIGKTGRAEEMIDILGLNNHKLCESRKVAISNCVYQYGLGDPSDVKCPIDVECDELLLSVCDDICRIDENGKMIPFAPIVANAIKNWIGNK